MVDVHTPEARSRNMAAIRGVDTTPELHLRRLLFAEGFRYRLHDRRLPGRPDLVLPKHRAVIFVHGCFFHGHECAVFRWPQSRAEFWRTKIQSNRTRDKVTVARLRRDGWRVLIAWECALRGRHALAPLRLAGEVSRWLHSQKRMKEIRGLA